MNIIWFWTIGAMLIAYAVLDGYDLGVGALHPWLAKTDSERRMVLNSIGPVWNGNEVWLLAGGGMLVVAFPRVYAVGFSGFYLALMVVLWLLILRGVSIEFRGQLEDPLWRTLWDTGFWLGSLLISLLLGVALGNVLRGLPIGQDGTFQGTFALMLNPYSVLTGLLSVAVLGWHGANYLRVKCDGDLLTRARAWSAGLWWAVMAMTVVVTIGTFVARPTTPANFRAFALAALLPVITLVALGWGFIARKPERDSSAFRSSTLLIISLLGTAAATVFPNLLTSTISPDFSLTLYNAASTPHALRAAFLANIFGMIAVITYTTLVHRYFSGRVGEGEGHY
jgi:cytochrome bd ubiquinol oxidase subunit II